MGRDKGLSGLKNFGAGLRRAGVLELGTHFRDVVFLRICLEFSMDAHILSVPMIISIVVFRPSPGEKRPDHNHRPHHSSSVTLIVHRGGKRGIKKLS